MKSFNQFIQEATTKSDKLLGRLKMLYNLPSDKKKYFKQQNPSEFDRLKKARSASPQVAQLTPPKQAQIKGDPTTVLDLRSNQEKMDALKQRVKIRQRHDIL